MALLNRFSKLNDRGETGIFTFIVTKSVTRDFHRDATTKDFCFGYHRWAISFQRPTEKVLGVHLILRNPSPNTACVVDFTLALLNREHFSQNEVYTKRQAKFTITNPMQGVSHWIQMSDLVERHFSNETGEFLFELSLSNMTTIFECDIQLNPTILTQYKSILKNGLLPNAAQQQQQQQKQQQQQPVSNGRSNKSDSRSSHGAKHAPTTNKSTSELINLETNYFTFGAFDWSLTIVPLVIPSQQQQQQCQNSSQQLQENSSNSSSSSNTNLLTPNKQHSNSSLSISCAQNGSKKSVQQQQQQQRLEPVCRVYLNRLNGYDCLCRVKYRVILGHHQPGGPHPAEFVDSKVLDQISDSDGRIRGYQFRNINLLKLISLRSAVTTTNHAANSVSGTPIGLQMCQSGHQQQLQQQQEQHLQHQAGSSASLDLRVHIEMFCANTISEARVPLRSKPNEAQVSNCSDRNKQAWCVESDNESENVRLKLFFMDLQSVPRNHIRYISWIAYIVRRDSKSGAMKESIAVRNSPHSNYYMQDGIDMGTIMDTNIQAKELNNSSKTYLGANQLTVHIEWVDSLLLFSHLYNNYDSLATIQRHQISRELCALQREYEHLEEKYIQSRRNLSQLLNSSGQHSTRADYSPNSPPSSGSLTMMPSMQLNSHEPTTRSKSSTRASSLQLNDTQQMVYHFSSPILQAANKLQNQNMIPLALTNRPLDAQNQSNPGPPQSQRRASMRMLLSMGEQWSPESSSNQISALAKNQYQKIPMCHDERLKFSSSTPPGPLGQQQQQSGRHALDNSQKKHHQHRQDQLKACSALSQCVRRRLPQEPGKLQQHPTNHKIDRRDSQISYQRAVVDQQQQALRGSIEPGAGTSFENCAQSFSPVSTSKSAAAAAKSIFVSTKLASIEIDTSSIDDPRPSGQQQQQQQQSSTSESLIQDQRQPMSIMMKETVVSQQQLLNQAETEQVDKYQLSALNCIGPFGQRHQLHSPIPSHHAKTAPASPYYSPDDDKIALDSDESAGYQSQARRRPHGYSLANDTLAGAADEQLILISKNGLAGDDFPPSGDRRNHHQHQRLAIMKGGTHEPVPDVNLDLEMEALYISAGDHRYSDEAVGQQSPFVYELRQDSAPIYSNKSLATDQAAIDIMDVISRSANNFTTDRQFEPHKYAQHYGPL